MKNNLSFFLEWGGVLLAILYSLLVAFNIGFEFLGFILLLVSAFFIGLWSYYKNYKGILILQIFYASAGIIGIIRWYE